ncbi:hypothetical protein [Streptomyces sp. NPDC005799]|uniref:hypothetical protein n=1 Tax=Streptomyces sp. NPDC005799 TaxID=3154678 RepID=UPI0034041AD2
MDTANLTPISAFDDARAKACAAAGAMIPLVARTLHAQYPTGRYLVLTRPTGDYDDECVNLHSVRDAQGEIVREFNPYALASERLPDVPEEIAALWGAVDPRMPEAVQGLIQAVDDVAPYEFLDFLPAEFRTDEEIEAEDEGGRTPLGIPLPCPCGSPGGECAPCCDSKDACPTVCSGCTLWRPEC